MYLDELKLDSTGTIDVMLCRIWDVNASTNGRYLGTEFLVSDAKIISNLLDVAGYVTNVGRLNYTKTGRKNLDFYLANQSGQSIRLTLWGGLVDVLVEKKARYTGMCPVVVTSTFAKEYNNKLYLSSSSSTVILDDGNIPAIKALKTSSGFENSKASSRVDNSEPKEGTIENLLIWARNRTNDSATFLCKARIDNVRTRKGWNFPSCGGEKCKKGATRRHGRFWCDSCDTAVEYPVIRYRLELGISDDTAATVVVLFDEPATSLVKFPASALLDSEHEDIDEHANLPTAIANIIGTTHVFEIKTHTYYEYGTFESFTCWTINPPQPFVESSCSSTIDDGNAIGGSTSKTPTKPPSVDTPTKPTERVGKKKLDIGDSGSDNELILIDNDNSIGDKKSRSLELEDSDAEDGQDTDDTTRRKRRNVVIDSE